jgi:hypothetical protein
MAASSTVEKAAFFTAESEGQDYLEPGPRGLRPRYLHVLRAARPPQPSRFLSAHPGFGTHIAANPGIDASVFDG